MRVRPEVDARTRMEAAVFEDIIIILTIVGDIDRYGCGSQGEYGYVGDCPLRPVLGNDRHPVAMGHSQTIETLLKRLGEAGNQVPAPGPPFFIKFIIEKGSLPHSGSLAIKKRRQIPYGNIIFFHFHFTYPKTL